jgi:hypothetical protein
MIDQEDKHAIRARGILYCRDEHLLPRLLVPREYVALYKVLRNTSEDPESDRLVVDNLFAEMKVDEILSHTENGYDRQCFVCGKAMQPSCCQSCARNPREIALLPPNGGTTWESDGNYGSTVWDPINETAYLHIVICDECLKAGSHRVRFLRKQSKIEVTEQRPWNKDED